MDTSEEAQEGDPEFVLELVHQVVTPMFTNTVVPLLRDHPTVHINSGLSRGVVFPQGVGGASRMD